LRKRRGKIPAGTVERGDPQSGICRESHNALVLAKQHRTWVDRSNEFIPLEPSVVNRIPSFKCDAFAAQPGNWTVHRAIV